MSMPTLSSAHVVPRSLGSARTPKLFDNKGFHRTVLLLLSSEQDHNLSARIRVPNPPSPFGLGWARSPRSHDRGPIEAARQATS